MEPINYKALLIKYIDHVLTEEGTTFITPYMGSEFSTEELAFLLQIRPIIAETRETLVRGEKYTEKMKYLLLQELTASVAARP